MDFAREEEFVNNFISKSIKAKNFKKGDAVRKVKLFEILDGLIQPFVYLSIFLELIGVVIYAFIYPLVGYIFIGMPVLVVLVFFIGWVLLGYHTCLDEQYVSYRWSIIFNCELRKEKWSNLQSFEIKKLCGVDENVATIFHSFFCLYFSGCNLEAYWLRDIHKIRRENGVIIILDTKRNRRLLREYLPDEFKAKLD